MKVIALIFLVFLLAGCIIPAQDDIATSKAANKAAQKIDFETSLIQNPELLKQIDASVEEKLRQDSNTG